MSLKNVDDVYALSPMQRLMLMNVLGGSDPTLLRNQVQYEITGDFREDLFRRAWDAVVAQHAALRTAVLWEGLERPVQVVRSEIEVPFEAIDLREYSAAEQASRLDVILEEDASRPFHLGSAPLMRCTLVRLGPELYRFVWTVHHLIVDRWSHEALFSDLARAYTALSRGDLPQPTAQASFRDYIAWLQRQDEREAERFWAEELRGFRRATPFGRALAGGGASRRAVTRRSLPVDAWKRLRDRASAWKRSPGALILGAIGLDLARRNQSVDVVFGLTVSGRPAELEGVEHTVGSFVNNVPMRLRVDRSMPVHEWLAEVQRAQVRRGPYEYLSLATIRDVGDLAPGQELFDLLVVPNIGEEEEPRWPGFELRPLEATLDAVYPYVLGLEASRSGLEFSLVHRGDEGEADEFLCRLMTSVDELVAAPDHAKIGDLLPGLTEPPPPAAGRSATEDPGADAQSESSASLPLGDFLLATWSEVLGVQATSPDDDFFVLGGTSLQAAQILRRVERRTGRALPVSLLFEARSIRGLLERLDEGRLDTSPDRIPVRHREEPIPLSFAQERLWVLDQIEQGSSLYNLSVAYTLRGHLDPDVLRDSLDALVRRHETLRTHYPTKDGVPFQAIADPTDDAWDWGEEYVEPTLDRSEVQERVEAAAHAPLRLETGPLFRARLFRVGDEEHVLLLVMHHTISDAWSVGLLERELSRVYAALSAGRTPELDPLPIRYGDFAVWQRERLRGELLEEQLRYWREQLEGASPIELPTDRARPMIQSFRGAIHRVTLHPALTDSLKQLSREQGSTLFMTLMAAFHALLHRYAGQEDITVGTPYSGRGRHETEGLIGMFVNTILIRSSPTSETTFQELLHDVRSATLEAHSRQDLPFEKLVEELQPERDLSRNPLFQAMLALQDPREHGLDLPGIESRPFDLSQETSKFDLTLYLQETRSPAGEVTIEGIWEFATDLFDRLTIQRMHGHFVNLLEAIVVDPERCLATLPMTTEAERGALLDSGKGTSSGVGDDPLLLERFQAQVARKPGAVALTDGDEHVTYAEIDVRSSRLASYLLDLGARPESLIGIALPRSAELVVAMLAVLKSGAAYVPLDPKHPPERLAFMLADTEASTLLTISGLVSSFPAFEGRVLCMDRDQEAWDTRSGSAPPVKLARDQLAYTIYTSGSTGRPKGVDVTQGNLAHFLSAMIDYPGLSEDDVVLAKTTVAFDPSVVELLATLTVGARMVIARAEEVSTGPSLSACIESSGATLVQATPATLHMLFESGWKGAPSVRLLVGGEALSQDLARRLVAACGEVWNIYGPTEETVWSTAWRVPREVDQIRIGTAMGATRVVVLDEQMQPTPVGVIGELYVGGGGVTRGYRNRPDLTAASFVANPFEEIPGDRLYRTGDLARLRHDGTFESLGRRDNQVQLRGFRIELGEIEGVLLELDGIRRAVVTVVDVGTPDARLVAYVLLEPGVALTPSEIRRYLRGRLPDYMVPGLVVELDAFPMTPTGKVDRRALPNPLVRSRDSSEGFEPPSTPEEALVAEVWAELLGIERIGRDDNFFQLGGHSLLALRATSAIAERHGRAFEPRAMFFQSLAQLAAQLNDQ